MQLTEEIKKKEFIYLVLFLAMAIAGILIREIFLSPEVTAPPQVSMSLPQAKIDFALLEELQKKDFSIIEQLTFSQDDFGQRANPFEPYQ